LPELEAIRQNSSGYPAFGLSHSSQGYPPDKPASVRFRYVPSSPFSFLQTPLLPVTPLPTGLPSRWLGGMGFFQPTGSADMLGEQKQAAF
jgi:hypothetical protein